MSLCKIGHVFQHIKHYFLFVILVADASTIMAQDTHYNTIQFGARSALMGGAVVGSVKDNTAIFYNPAGLGFVDTNYLTINGNAYQYDNIRIINALGNQQDYKSSQLAAIPLFVGGMFTKGKQRLKIGYSIMSAVDFDYNTTARIDKYEPVVADTESPGEEEFIGQTNIRSSVNELVFGIGGGYKISEHWSIGLTNLVTVRSVNYNRVTYSRFYLNNSNNPLVTSSFSRGTEYYHVRYSAKIGLNYRNKNFSAGIAIGTPSIGIMGDGNISVDMVGTNILYKGNRMDLLANDRQDDLKSHYKSPFSVTAGANYSFYKSAFGLAVQYYGSVGIYDVLHAEPAAFVRPAELYTSLGSDEFLMVKEAAVSVVNLALGYEYTVNPKLVLIASFRTNQSYFNKDLNKIVGIKTDITSWDINHLTVGGTFSIGRSKITLGVLYSAGKDRTREEIGNLEQPSEDNFLQGAITVTKATYNSIGILLGYSFALKK